MSITTVKAPHMRIHACTYWPEVTGYYMLGCCLGYTCTSDGLMGTNICTKVHRLITARGQGVINVNFIQSTTAS